MGTTPKTGREYLRVSLDRSGRARSVEEQHDDNAKAAADRGITLGKHYVDNSVSASRYSTKSRDGFKDLMTDLDKGRFGPTNCGYGSTPVARARSASGCSSWRPASGPG